MGWFPIMAVLLTATLWLLERKSHAHYIPAICTEQHLLERCSCGK